MSELQQVLEGGCCPNCGGDLFIAEAGGYPEWLKEQEFGEQVEVLEWEHSEMDDSEIGSMVYICAMDPADVFEVWALANGDWNVTRGQPREAANVHYAEGGW